MKLPEGTHEIDIVLDGYQPQHLTVEVDAKGATIPPVALQPLTAFLRLGMSAGKAELNGQPVSNKSGIFNQDLPPDNYTLKLVQDKAMATIEFKVAAGAMPEVTEVKASNMTVNAVAVLGKRTRVYGAGAANFIEIPDLAPGPQVITIGEGGATQLQVEIGAAPSLQVIVTDPEKVNLLITSNEDGASVLIDGAAAGVIRNGKFLTSRKPGPYTVAVEKPVSPARRSRRCVSKQASRSRPRISRWSETPRSWRSRTRRIRTYSSMASRRAWFPHRASSRWRSIPVGGNSC